MNIRHWLIVGATSIFSSLAMIAFPAMAETKRVDYTLSADNQTFPGLIEQAKSVAVSLISQGFAESPNITQVSVTVLGERNGQQVPLLFSTVSRSQWESQPSIQQWAKYPGRSSKVLLGLGNPQTQRSGSYLPAAPNVPASPPSNAATPPGVNGASVEESDPGYR